MPYSIAELNQMTQAAFVDALGAVFEDTPAIARDTWNRRPFTNVDDLHQKMVSVVNGLSEDDQLDLICAHPDLGSKAKMAEASVQEQAGVGLDRLSPEEFERFQALNHQYREQFGFPFIIAVKNHTKTSILQAFEQRLQNDAKTEQQQAITEITQIARFRLADLIPSNP
ncbi:MAG: 2-oxo-4-hydroxy-4-carboxy-5-ureidoimidazoline decarboxylase [Oscillatoriales cyanobacterium C42_A2020_001]|nr:2-oxo-4-hydroxy-4-carboxy-5-ureidoimidazoline decarboxylase [Leptolyngbyaceae cyanobacterium C42_A2020_001]